MKKKEKAPPKRSGQVMGTCRICTKYVVIVANMGGPVCEKCFDKAQRGSK